MNKEWSELNKLVQVRLKKEATYKEGIKTLFVLRKQLMNIIISFESELSREDFNSMPFINAGGYHNKTIAYSLWHIFRIEDIVAHSLINEDEQKSLNVVSIDEHAIWLIDYWCGKDIKGLLQMPFLRHWIMHIEASLRIKNKMYCQKEKNNERCLSDMPTV